MGHTRRAVLRSVAVGVAGTAACVGRAPSRSFEHDWPMFRYDPARTGSNRSVEGPVSDPEVRWSTSMGDVWSSPVVRDGTLYVGSYDENLHALDAVTGDTVWTYEVGAHVDGTPAVYDGTVYVGGFDMNVHAVDAESGEREWIHETGGYIRSSPTVVDDTLYVGGNCRILECAQNHDLPEQEHGDVFALDPETGDVEWHYETEKGVISSPAVVDDTVYVASREGTVHALDAEMGDRQWHYETELLVVSTPAIGDGSLYVADWGGNVYGIDKATGDEQWVLSTEAQYVSGSPAVLDGTVYVGVAAVPEKNPEGAERPYEMRGELLAVDGDDGTRLWTHRTDAIEIGSSPAVTGDAIYVGSHSLRDDVPGWVYAVDPDDGTEHWKHRVEGIGVGSSPAVVDGTVLFGDATGAVVALG